MDLKLQREEFEAAAYNYYLERHAAGKLPDSGQAPMIKEGVMWRHEDGTYGVLMFNAAWWAWQTGQAVLMSHLVAPLDRDRLGEIFDEHMRGDRTFPNYIEFGDTVAKLAALAVVNDLQKAMGGEGAANG